LMYMINFGKRNMSKNQLENHGFIVIAADNRITPILAKSDSGSIDPYGDNRGLKIWIDYVSKAIIDGKKHQSQQSEDSKALWRRYDKDYLKLKKARTMDCTDPPCPGDPCPVDYFYQSPILTSTTWEQGPPYNMFCPTSGSSECGSCGRAWAGCGAVAIAYVFNRYKKPATYTIAPAGPVNYAYPLANKASVINCKSVNVKDVEIASLIRSAGMWANTNYAFYHCNSFTWREQIKNAFVAAGYTNAGNRIGWNSNYTIVNSEIQSGHPVIIDATTGFVQFNDWHIWVIDGYQQYITYHKSDPQNPFSSCLGTEYAYYHMNWGWGKDSIGWFGMGNFTVSGKEYDYDMNVTLGMRP
jgi:hypothetical protein